MEDGGIGMVEQVSRVGADEILVVGLFIQIPDQLFLEQRVKMDFGFLDADDRAVQRSRGGSQNDDLVDAGAERFQRHRPAIHMNDNGLAAVRDFQFCAGMIGDFLQKPAL